MKLFQFTYTEKYTQRKSRSASQMLLFLFFSFYDSRSSNFNYSRFHSVYVKHAVGCARSSRTIRTFDVFLCFCRALTQKNFAKWLLRIFTLTHHPESRNASNPDCELPLLLWLHRVDNSGRIASRTVDITCICFVLCKCMYNISRRIQSHSVFANCFIFDINNFHIKYICTI